LISLAIYLVFELVMIAFNLPRRIEVLRNEEELEANYRAYHAFYYWLVHPDAEMGFMVSAYLDQKVCFNEVCAHIETDDLGFRNRPGDRDEASIVAMGDSFVWGYGVELSRSWPRLIENALGVRLANFSIIAGFPAQYPVCIRRNARYLRDKRIILGLYTNDYKNNADQHLEDYYQASNLDVFHREEPGFSDLVRMKRLSFFQRSATATLIRILGEDRGPRQPMRRMENEIDRAWLEGGGWEHLETTFEAILVALRENESALCVVLFPSRLSARKPEYARMHGETEQIDLEEEYYARTHRFFEQRNVPVLDLTAAARRAAARTEVLYHRLDPHFNDRGNALAAAEIETFLRRVWGEALH
jgi:hypothetical protein